MTRSLLVVALLLTVAVGASGALASGAGGWAPGVEAAVPANADANTGMGAVSCVSAGSCSAVGFYTDSSFDVQGLLLSESSGKWAPGVAASLPANASSDPAVTISSVSCTSLGNCSAVGSYDSTSGQQGLLLTEQSGAWSRGVEAVVPANAPSNPDVHLSSVSCSSPGVCSAAGSYADSSNSPEGLLLSERSGVWSTGVEAVLPAGAAAGGSGLSGRNLCDPHSPCVEINSVSCGSAGNCAAVGTYNDSSGTEQAVLLNENSGVWARGAEATLPANAFRNPDAALSSVSCTAAGNCSAVGTYNYSSSNSAGLLVSETAGRWTRGVEATLPAGAGRYVQLNSVSCTSPGNCAAAGYYNNSSNDAEGLLLSESHGRWLPGVEATPPANAGNNPLIGTAYLFSVSCAAVGDCAAAGSYHDASGNSDGLLLSERSGKWASGVEAHVPANAGTVYPAEAEFGLGSLSCAPAGNCAAVGSYTDSSHNAQGLLVAGALAVSPHNTTVTRVRINRKRHTASFTFTATGATRFQCALVTPRARGRRHKRPNAIFRSCATPKAYKHLKHGHYTFEVRGVSSAGIVDPKPAIKHFII